MEWLCLVVPVIILLKVVEKNGDWFDFLDMGARYDNWWTNFDFMFCLPIFGVCAVGLAAVVLISVARPMESTAFVPVNQATVVAGHGHNSSVHVAKMHKAHAKS